MSKYQSGMYTYMPTPPNIIFSDHDSASEMLQTSSASTIASGDISVRYKLEEMQMIIMDRIAMLDKISDLSHIDLRESINAIKGVAEDLVTMIKQLKL